MCVVSMVSDHYFKTRPEPYQWNWPTWQEYLELKRKAELYDLEHNQPHCEKEDLASKEAAVLTVLQYRKEHFDEK